MEVQTQENLMRMNFIYAAVAALSLTALAATSASAFNPQPEPPCKGSCRTFQGVDQRALGRTGNIRSFQEVNEKAHKSKPHGKH